MTTTTTQLDVTHLRTLFPALTLTTDQGEPFVFLDGPGGTQVPTSVIDAVSEYYRTSNSNTGAEFILSKKTSEVIERAHSQGGAFVGGDPAGIVFGPNATTLNFMLSRSIARQVKPGDEIVVTALDHDSNVAPWLLLAQDLGLTVRTVGLNESMEIDLASLRDLVGSKTRIVAFSLASNATGTLTQAEQIVQIAHDAGALAWADGVAYAAHRRLNVTALDLDVLLTSPYKYFAPHLGMAWIRPDLAATLTPEQIRPASHYLPVGHRFEAGTLSYEALAGFSAAIDYLASLGEGEALNERLDEAFHRIQAHEAELTERLYAGLESFNKLRIIGLEGNQHDRRLGIISVAVEGGGTAELAGRLGVAGLLCWSGNFYAQNLMEELGIDMDEGLLRFGVLHYNTLQDIDRALEILRTLVD